MLAYPDVNEAARWLCDAFGFTVRLRIGDHRIQLNVGVGDGAVVVKQGAASASDDSVMVRVENIDQHHSRAVKRGAQIALAPESHMYGERQYTAQDPAGHTWTFSESIQDVDPRDWGGEPVQLY